MSTFPARDEEALYQLRTDPEAYFAQLKLDSMKYAAVKVPERIDGHWLVDPDDDDFHVSRVHLVETSTGRGVTGCRVTWGSIELTLSPAHAAALAGALLAAVKCGELG